MSRNIRLTVAAVVEHEGRYLCVEERIRGALRINQPAGHLEPGESLLAATVREALEETAHDFVPESLLGIYRWQHPATGATYVRVALTGRVSGPRPGRALDRGIERALWLSIEELRQASDRHRSPLVMRCVEDHAAGRRYPLALLREGDA